MRWLSSLWNGIKSAISSVLGNSELMQKLMPRLMEFIPPPYDLIAVFAIVAISAAMGVEEDPDKLGWQMNEADKKPEDFGSFKEYKEYLDREYPFDQEKYNCLSEEQKSACRYVGMAGMIQELKESNGFELTPESLGVIAKGVASLEWNEAQIIAFARGLSVSLAASGAASLADVDAFAKGMLDPEEYQFFSDAISAGVKEAGVKQDNVSVIASLQENV